MILLFVDVTLVHLCKSFDAVGVKYQMECGDYQWCLDDMVCHCQ